MELLLDSLFNGVAIGSVLLVAALGLAIVFGLMGVINLAHGELMMLGAYTTYVTQLIFKLPILKPFYNSYIIVSIFLAFIVSGVVGILLEKTIIRKLYGSPLETLLATWGVSLILQQFVRSVPLAYGTGLVISLLIGLFLPTIFPSKIRESINYKYFKFSVLYVFCFYFVSYIDNSWIAGSAFFLEAFLLHSTQYGTQWLLATPSKP